MAKSLQEYADWLDERELPRPAPPETIDAKAAAFTKPLKDIRAVTWSIYGTLLRITDGQLLFDHPETMRMQIALEKTIQEFKMWNSMYRQPGAPWEQLHTQYRRLLEDQRQSDTRQKGDFPEVDAPRIWRKLLGRLGEKEYSYDMALYGDPEEFSDKVAYFFHTNLQGVEAAPHARDILTAIADSPLRQTLLSDAQPFTIVQMLRALQVQGTLPPLGSLFSLAGSVLSFQEGLRKPSESLYARALQNFEKEGISPQQVLHISSRLPDDLAVAKKAGMRTALYAADKTSRRATKDDMKNQETRPDRLLTDLAQLREVLSLEKPSSD